MLSCWQADGPDVVWVTNRWLQLHQSDVIVESELVVVWVRNDLLQIPFHHAVAVGPLSVKAKVGFPCARLRVPEKKKNQDNSLVQAESQINIEQHIWSNENNKNGMRFLLQCKYIHVTQL